jgi:MoxR-like ATPase
LVVPVNKRLASISVDNPSELKEALVRVGYFADLPLSTVVYLALALERPLLLEGDPGVGKTELAFALGRLMGSETIRLQCYEGIDSRQALYDWNYSRQILHIRVVEAKARGDASALAHLDQELYSSDYLIARPLLKALMGTDASHPPVLLIDELDRADDEFEALLLEVLSSFTVSVPEIGSIDCRVKPIVVVTSNRSRDLHDAVKRRCLYYWVKHPDFDRELEIVRYKVPDSGERIRRQVTALVQQLRLQELFKPPGVAETIDWAQALNALAVGELDPDTVEQTLGVVLKHREDLEKALDIGTERLLKLADAGSERDE